MRIEDETAEVIEGSDEPPLFTGGGGPQVPRGVVLNELAGVVGEDFTVVDRSLGFSKAKTVFSGPVDDGG